MVDINAIPQEILISILNAAGGCVPKRRVCKLWKCVCDTLIGRAKVTLSTAFSRLHKNQIYFNIPQRGYVRLIVYYLSFFNGKVLTKDGYKYPNHVKKDGLYIRCSLIKTPPTSKAISMYGPNTLKRCIYIDVNMDTTSVSYFDHNTGICRRKYTNDTYGLTRVETIREYSNNNYVCYIHDIVDKFVRVVQIPSDFGDLIVDNVWDLKRGFSIDL